MLVAYMALGAWRSALGGARGGEGGSFCDEDDGEVSQFSRTDGLAAVYLPDDQHQALMASVASVGQLLHGLWRALANPPE